MERVNELHQVLVEHLKSVAEMEPAAGRVTVDLSKVSEIDACGCQLLALFVENLKRFGITPATASEAPVTQQIALLGFGDLLTGKP